MAPPALPVPKGPVPTADGISPIAVKQVVVSSVMTFLAFLAVLMRFWARKIKNVRPATEDWLVVMGLIWTIGYAIANIMFAAVGTIGWDANVLAAAGRLDRITAGLKTAIAGQVLYALALGSIKSSICVTLLRIFWRNKMFRVMGFFVLFLCVGWALQTILIAFLICRPLSYNWDSVGVKGTCGNLHAAYLSVGVVDVLTDFLVFVLPMPMISSLKMPTRAKVATCGVFALGLLTISAGVARTVSVSIVEFDPSDVETAVDLTVWSVVEPCVGLIVACLIVMRPLMAHLGDKLSQLSSSFGFSRKTTVPSHSSGKRTDLQSSLDDGRPFVKLDTDQGTHQLKDLSTTKAESVESQELHHEVHPYRHYTSPDMV